MSDPYHSWAPAGAPPPPPPGAYASAPAVPRPPPPPKPAELSAHPDDQLLNARAGLRKTGGPNSDRAKSPVRGTASSVLAGEALFGLNLSSSSLSFLTPEKAQYYKDIFDEAGPVLPRFASERGFLEHEKALAEFKKTGCPDDFVQMIWALCNVTPSPGYTLPEFCLAMSLCERAAADPDGEIPTHLDDLVIKEVQIASGYTAPEDKRPAASPSSAAGRTLPAPEVGAARPMRPEVQTGRAKDAENPFRAMMRTPEAPAQPAAAPPPPPPDDGPIPRAERQKAADLFGALKGDDNLIDGLTVKELFTEYGLPDSALAQAWDLCSRTVPGKLTQGEFAVALHLVDGLKAGTPLPAALDPGLLGVLAGR
ncbi:hypothetical protein DFJ74DRAFT_747325 [Hyaloraphidium curvatum]|nr:hypothetical protein DFJ74DRAFT_747325 [Hyaloraphidium curvatum]